VSVSDVAKRYLERLIQVLGAIDPGSIEPIARRLDRVLEERARVYVIGNGGSAATAAHLCSDLGIGLKRRGRDSFDIQSLGENPAVCTAIANDLSYEDVFSAQLDGLLRPKDVLIAISASGNSPNIVKAVRHARLVGASVIGWTGFDGGLLRGLADISFHVATPVGAYGVVEDAHLALNHILFSRYADEH
jgi:D-sedoheptulose 7-phosphate isomerase